MKKINFNRISPSEIGKWLANFWLHHYKKIFFIYLLLTVGGGLFVWYQSSYGVTWSEEKKQQYLNSKDVSVSLRENDFKKALEVIESRKRQYDEPAPQVKNIFK